MKCPLIGVLEAETGDGTRRRQAWRAKLYVVEPGHRRWLDVDAQPGRYLPGVFAAPVLGGLLRLEPIHPYAAPRLFASLHARLLDPYIA
jgi:hypothetical protein